LLNNKIDVKQKTFVKEQDIMEIYVNLKNVPKCPVTTNSNFKTVDNSKKSKTRTTGKSGNTFNSLASEIESFTEDI